ncbi:MAG: deoxyribodipyrimidine photolyase [Caulobacteraceae bacterium]|nr:deoxyribodipyrimidine photolyase [Caulobacteraceae bacterium]
MTQGQIGGDPVVLWFRQDLRLEDNPALAEALTHRAPLIPLYVLDDETGRKTGAAARWWLDKSLAALAASLEARGSRLILLRGRGDEVVANVVEATGAKTVVWSRLYDQASIARDDRLVAKLKLQGVAAVSCNSTLLEEPWDVLNGEGGPYRVFTAYWRRARARITPGPSHRAPTFLPAPRDWPASLALHDLALHPTAPDWSGGFSGWSPGEAGAQSRLDDFVDHGLAGYHTGRDQPGRDGSSRLSPHLRWGEIGPRQVWRAVETAVERGCASHDEAEAFLRELGWREFNFGLLHHLPEIARQPMKPSLDSVSWRHDPAALEAWRSGLTGYPIVDAGMRQLWRTGWMHNRVRMIVASFLVKHLLIDWREGEAWFWDTLIDADLANNAANWQWVAGCGADSQPWFRVFNPILQGEKFDPDGEYVRAFVPELAKLPASLIHKPWTGSQDELSQAGLKLGHNYPYPIVEHSAARRRALDALHHSRQAA